MTLSKELDDFLQWLNDRGEQFEAQRLKELVGSAGEPAPGAGRRFDAGLRRHVATALIAASRKGAIPGRVLESFGGSDPEASRPEAIDNWLTRVTLAHIPDWVRRYTRLSQMLGEEPLPSKVAMALEQAGECYIRELDAAAATSCRCVLEMALEQRVGASMSNLLRAQGNDYLNKLIDWTRTAKQLPAALVAEAHKVRRAGNRAVHTGECTEKAALVCLDATKRILGHLYRLDVRRSG